MNAGLISATPTEKKVSRWVFFTAATVYLTFSFAGIRYGLPDNGHSLSYNCDELNYIEVLSHLKPSQGKLNPHPFFTHPTCYLFMNATGLFVAQKLGWIPQGDKEFFRQHPELFARFYLVGRMLQVICGLIILFVCWLTLQKTLNDYVACTTVLFLSVCPSLVAASHFSQASIPVALFTTLSLACLWLGASKNFSLKHLFWGSFMAGVAVGTKYSALALLAPVAYYSFKTDSKAKNAALAFLLIAGGFVLTNPFSVLATRSFIEAASFNMRSNQLPIPSLVEGLLFSLRVAFPQALGWPLMVLCGLGIILTLLRPKAPLLTLMLVWIGGFYAATVRVGYIATSARVLISIPAIIVMSALFLDYLRHVHPKGKIIGTAVFCLVFVFTARYSLAIIDLRLTYPSQKQSSDWVVQNIPRDKTIAIPKVIYWWTPDVLYKSAHHPERQHKPYQVDGYDFSLEKIKANKPDYAINTEWERTMCTFFAPVQSCHEYFDYFENSGEYERVKRFPREVKFRSWNWHRPEILFHFDDDLWVTAMTVYQRKG